MWATVGACKGVFCMCVRVCAVPQAQESLCDREANETKVNCGCWPRLGNPRRPSCGGVGLSALVESHSRVVALLASLSRVC